MITSAHVDGLLARFPRLPAILYAAVIGTLCLTSLSIAFGMVERFLARNESLETLARLEEHAKLSSHEDGSGAGAWPSGSPFLEGQTVTIASAALVQRVTNAIAKVAGNVVSSEVDPQGSQSKDGYVKVTATCEVEQFALQELLHDLESGMPFLFVDQLAVQAPAEQDKGGMLRVVIGVSGLWPGAQ